jgi:hypothetical protein
MLSYPAWANWSGSSPPLAGLEGGHELLVARGAETAGKSVELLRDMLPSLRRVAVLANPADPFTIPFLEQVQLAGRAAAIEIAPIAMARGAGEVEAAFGLMTRERAEAVVVQGIFFSKTIADLALQHAAFQHWLCHLP